MRRLLFASFVCLAVVACDSSSGSDDASADGAARDATIDAETGDASDAGVDAEANDAGDGSVGADGGDGGSDAGTCASGEEICVGKCGVVGNGCDTYFDCSGVTYVATGGLACNQPGDTCQSDHSCLHCATPTEACAGKCGLVGDGCGHMIDCSAPANVVLGGVACTGGMVCSGGGTCEPPPPCVPTLTCASMGSECGSFVDDCGETVDCWPAGQTSCPDAAAACLWGVCIRIT